MRWRTSAALATVVAALLSGCGHSDTSPPTTYDRPSRELTPQFAGAPALPPPDLTDDGPGSLVRVEPVVDNASFDSANAAAVKVVFRSTSGAGTPTQVTGVVAVPPGTPPPGGWPVVSFGHEMTGVMNKCAPSRAPDFWGYAAQMVTFLSRGFAVALPDFQGLGLEGPGHSVIDAATLGNNMIDAARAVRRVSPEVSSRWAAFGVGEGGLAAWAAAERAGGYGNGMEMVGAVAVSPYADLSPLADAAAAGTLTKGEQVRLYMMVLQSLAASPGFQLDAYRGGLARQRWNEILDCAPGNPTEAVRALDRIAPDDLRPRDLAATDDLRRRLSEAALPSPLPTPGSAPVLVIWGTGDTVVPGTGIDNAVVAACKQGDAVEVMRRIGDTKPVNDQVINSALSWLMGRFDGQQLADSCQGVT
ncbi:Pimeloyl-ACP methyl ester carboxylesterase [Mycolicibacterium rutilum]|uniref:Pimeloyl-ACP methyl ester carboxylesterase n=1 Tax=Mycolicibacterium rutilum TaxID=370526 RepID=A0A1H6M1E5_MYCRU|nr:lipase family protein [Mycolicibacterium rutilum]SEH91036.1 Pimeloyl-ACP methyl ester carboxylesterase [Mycolicibacterium rutilum]